MKLIFLFSCLLIGLLFEAVPYDAAPIDLFLFAEMAMPFKTWLYFLCEHFVLIMLAYIIAFEAKKYALSCKAFFWIQILDCIDYLLTYNTKWLSVISFNTASMIVLASFIVYEYVRGDHY